MRLLLTALAVSLVAAAASTLAAVIPRDTPLPPSRDPFYVPPGNLSSYQPGQIISSRVVAPPAVQDPAVGHVVQVLYRTINTNGNASSTVATVFTPTNPRADPAMLSLQFYEDSANIACAPSYSLMAGLSSPNWPTSSLDNPVITKWALNLGYYVVIADHEGPNSAFIAGWEEGQAGLDGIRAALASADLPTSTKIAMYGYSGGAHATAWMTNLAPTYAPELNVVGSAHGGTPVDLTTMVEFLEGSFFAGFVADGVAGVLNTYTQYNSLVTTKCQQSVQDAIAFLRTENNCLVSVVTHFNFQTFTDKCNFGNYTFYTYPPVADILGKETLLQNVTTVGVNVPKFPRLMWHSVGDEIVPFPPAQQYVEQQCAQGANLQFAALGFGEHVTGELGGLPGGLQFVQQSIEGTTPRVACGTTSNFLTLDAPNLADVLGAPTANSLLQLNATQKSPFVP